MNLNKQFIKRLNKYSKLKIEFLEKFLSFFSLLIDWQ